MGGRAGLLQLGWCTVADGAGMGMRGSGGLVQKSYPWGSELMRCNIWQGRFPAQDNGDDGYRGTAAHNARLTSDSVSGAGPLALENPENQSPAAVSDPILPTRYPKRFLTVILLVGAAGFELATPCSQSRCSTRLSYAPNLDRRPF